MRDSLALALVRAEFCRAYAESSQPKDKAGGDHAGAVVARLWRSLRRLRRPRVAPGSPPSD